MVSELMVTRESPTTANFHDIGLSGASMLSDPLAHATTENTQDTSKKHFKQFLLM